MSGLTKFVYGWTKCCRSNIKFCCSSVIHSHENECFVNFFSENESSIRLKKRDFIMITWKRDIVNLVFSRQCSRGERK